MDENDNDVWNYKAVKKLRLQKRCSKSTGKASDNVNNWLSKLYVRLIFLSAYKLFGQTANESSWASICSPLYAINCMQ